MTDLVPVDGAEFAPQGVAVRVTPSGAASRGPWRTALATLSRNRVSMAALAVLVLIVVSCLLAPL